MPKINLLFSHGYGVKKDSKGLFSAIVDALPNDVRPVLFDYYKIEGKNMIVRPPSEMIALLRKMYSQLEGETWLIGHSMGCSLIAQSGITPNKTIFLAPPTFMSRRPGDFRSFFLERHPDAIVDNNTISIRRKNGGLFTLPNSWFEELAVNPNSGALLKYIGEHVTTIIFAENDLSTPIPEDNHEFWDTNPHVQIIPGNHNFDPPHRDNLVQTVIQLLQ